MYPAFFAREDTDTVAVKGLYLQTEGRPSDISGYARLYTLRSYDDDIHPHYRLHDDTLSIIMPEGDTVLSVSYGRHGHRTQLSGTGYRPGDTVAHDGRLAQGVARQAARIPYSTRSN